MTPVSLKSELSFPTNPSDIEAKVIELQKRNQELEARLIQSEKLEVLGQLAAGIAHDLNNVLAVIGMHSDLILAELSPENLLKPEIEKIKCAKKRGSSLTREVLAFASRPKTTSQMINVDETLKAMIGLLRRLVPENQELHFHNTTDEKWTNLRAGTIEVLIAKIVHHILEAINSATRLEISTKLTSFEAETTILGQKLIPGIYTEITIQVPQAFIDRKSLMALTANLLDQNNTEKNPIRGVESTAEFIARQAWKSNLPTSVTVGSVDCSDCCDRFQVYLPTVDRLHVQAP